MNASPPDPARTGARLIDRAAGASVRDRDATTRLDDLREGSALGGAASGLAGRSVLVSVSTQVAAALAMVELDGLVRRLVLAPPDLAAEHLRAVIEDAEVEAIVSDTPGSFGDFPGVRVVALSQPAPAPRLARIADTEWTMLTSGTSGRPKMVAHTLAALTGAIPPRSAADTRVVWATFYDIRRYGGLQMFLRAMIGGTPIVLTSPGETLVDHLHRLGREGVTSISGTPSHWRRVLMTADRGVFAPAYVRLSGEIADQAVLDALRAAFPASQVGHAYASTEAGVAFAVDDGREGFPTGLVESPRNNVEMRVVDGALQIRSPRIASRYIGPNPPVLTDAEGFVDTGDLVERRGDRFVFAGRRGGIINVGGLKVNPEEVEAVINAHPFVRMSLVRPKRNPVTGALVAADIVLRDGVDPAQARDAIVDMCAAALERHKAPAIIRFVAHLPLTPAGKLRRDGAPPTREKADA
jgi:acyl-CoA synthetase (AMP-forming)/AMP-acid ligase II